MWRKMGVGEVAGRLQTASGSRAYGERQQGKRRVAARQTAIDTGDR